jgi:hypothetical protein
MVLGDFRGVRQLSFMGVDLGHCVDGLRWFLESYAIFLYGGLIWGTVWMVSGGFWGVRQFSLIGINLGHCVDGFRWFLGS